MNGMNTSLSVWAILGLQRYSIFFQCIQLKNFFSEIERGHNFKSQIFRLTDFFGAKFDAIFMC